MPQILIRHEIADFDAWKSVFDEHASTRAEYGSQGYHLFRDAERPNDLVMLFEWDSMANAESFLEESDVEEKMGEGGVVGEPEIVFLEEIESAPSEKKPA